MNMIQSCKENLIPYLDEMRRAGQHTAETNIEEGFTVGVKPDGTTTLEKAVGDHLGVNVPRPVDTPFLNFHTHGPNDLAIGLSAGDTQYAYFREGIYPFHCVASTGYNKIYCYRPHDVINHPDYPKVFAEQVDLSLEHAKTTFKKCPSHRHKISDLLGHNQIRELIKYERRYCPDAAKIMMKMTITWNDFISKTKCAEFSMKGD